MTTQHVDTADADPDDSAAARLVAAQARMKAYAAAHGIAEEMSVDESAEHDAIARLQASAIAADY
jgi:hypothetical protein